MKHSILLCCAALLTVSEEVRSRCSLKHRKSLLISDLSMDPVPMDYSSHINDPSCRWGNREGEVGGGVFVCVCISPWISKEAKARDALPHTEHIWAWKSRLFDQCECTVPCFSNTHFLPWHGTVGGVVLLQGWKNGSRVPGISLPLHFRRQFFSTLVVKYFQFSSNDVQMLCDCR